MKSKLLSSIAALFLSAMLFLLLVFSDEAAVGAKNAMSMCCTSVLPPLFTYIAICGIIVRLDLLAPIYRLIPTDKLFRLPRCTAQVILIGLVCGFPVGASCTALLAHKGKITKDEASRLLALSSCASPAFMLSTLGSWYNDKAFGAVLYVTCVLSIVLFSVVISRTASKTFSLSVQPPEDNANKDFASAVCDSVSGAAQSSLNILAYITFFGVLQSIVSAVLPSLSFISAALFEFSFGAYTGAVTGGAFGAALSGFSVGFSSLSVFLQTYSYAGAEGIKMRHFLISKLICAVLSSAVGAIYYSIHSNSPTIKAAFAPTFEASQVISAIILLLTARLSCVLVSKINKFRSKS